MAKLYPAFKRGVTTGSSVYGIQTASRDVRVGFINDQQRPFNPNHVFLEDLGDAFIKSAALSGKVWSADAFFQSAAPTIAVPAGWTTNLSSGLRGLIMFTWTGDTMTSRLIAHYSDADFTGMPNNTGQGKTYKITPPAAGWFAL